MFKISCKNFLNVSHAIRNMGVYCNELAACNDDAQTQPDNMMWSLHSYVEAQMISLQCSRDKLFKNTWVIYCCLTKDRGIQIMWQKRTLVKLLSNVEDILWMLINR